MKEPLHKLWVKKPFFAKVLSGEKTVDVRPVRGGIRTWKRGDALFLNGHWLYFLQRISLYDSLDELLAQEDAQQIGPGMRPDELRAVLEPMFRHTGAEVKAAALEMVPDWFPYFEPPPPGPALVLPSLRFLNSFYQGVQETEIDERLRVGSHEFLSVFDMDSALWALEWLQQVNDHSKLPEGRVPMSSLWLVDGSEFIGRVEFFHWHDTVNHRDDGQVDYWIRPSRRKQGYGKIIWRLTVDRLRELGQPKVMISVLDDNPTSRRIIEDSGAVFVSQVREFPDREVMRRLYHLEIQPQPPEEEPR